MTAIREMGVIDTDSHVTEPPDLWTARLSARWGDAVPHVEWHADRGEHLWHVGDAVVTPVGFFATAGWREHLPSYPPSLEEADPGSFDPTARLARLDEYGIAAQILYPNLLAFFTHAFMSLAPELALDCVRAYNDFLTEFAAAAPDRLLPLTVLPFWDVEESVREIERGLALGHRGVLLAAFFDRIALPNIADPHWAPILDAAQALGQSVNLHVGFAATTTEQLETLTTVHDQRREDLAETSVLGFMANARAISLLTLKGVCHRYPRLRFVSVESGFGWVPFLLQSLDWQFENSGVRVDHPEWDRPSDYFRRQVYGTFWFEEIPATVLDAYQDNLMFETDYPHPTSLSPGPSSTSPLPVDLLERHFGSFEPSVVRKVLRDNAATLYRIG